MSYSAGDVDGSVDEMPFELEQCWLVDRLDQLLMQHGTGKVDLAD